MVGPASGTRTTPSTGAARQAAIRAGRLQGLVAKLFDIVRRRLGTARARGSTSDHRRQRHHQRWPRQIRGSYQPWSRSQTKMGQVENTRIPAPEDGGEERIQHEAAQPMAMPASSRPISRRSAIMRRWLRLARRRYANGNTRREHRTMPRFCANLTMMFNEAPVSRSIRSGG